MSPTALVANYPSPTDEVEAIGEDRRPLPSGRSVVVKVGEGGEELQVRSPEGEVEVVIRFTEEGPVVRLQAARLELVAAEAVAVTCQTFDVDARDRARFHAGDGVEITGRELRVRTDEDVHIDGAFVRLNCDES